MSYKNSIKLLSTNFSLVWKQLCYMATICFILFFVSYGFSIPTINILKSSGVVNEFVSIFETLYTSPKDVVTAVSETFLHFTTVISENFSKIWFSILSTTLLIQLIYQLLKNLSFYNLASLMHYHMTSYVNIGYTRNLISSLSAGIKYSFARLVYSIPFKAFKLVTIYAYFKLANSPLSIIIGLFTVSLILILISTFELTLFVGMTGYTMEKGGSSSAFKAFFKGNVLTLKNFPRVFSNALIANLTMIVINVFLGVFTLGVGLLITLPASMLFKAIFELTTYFGVKGERYYLSSTTIATPLKSAENENVNNIK